MLRRLFLGQPRQEAIKDDKKEICEEEKRTPDVFNTKSTANNLEEKNKAKDDIFDSDSDTDSSETEDSDAETLDNSSRTGSCEDCSGDVLGWKGFKMVEDAQGGQIDSNKGNGGTLEKMENHKGQEAKQTQKNPFANAFENQGSEMPPHIHDEIKSEIINSSYNNNSNNKNNTICNNNNDQNNNNESDNSESTCSQNNKQTHQANDNETPTTTHTNNIASTNDKNIKQAAKLTININNNTINKQKQLNNSKQQINKARQTKFDQSKTTLEFSKPPPTNRKLPTTRENQQTSNIKGKSSCKSPPSTSIPGKSSKVCKAEKSLMGYSSTSVDTKRLQGIGKDKTGLRGGRIGGKGKQSHLNSTHVSVQDLEKILGVNLAELREVIKTYKSEKINTAEDYPGQSEVAQGNLGSPGTVGDHLVVDRKKSQDGCKKEDIKEGKSETIDNKDEISSDSGVSEPDAHNTYSRPHYIPLKTVIKRKEYLEGQIRKLVDRVVVMGDHKKDIQFVHDLFDLHSDGLAKVERSNGGVVCVENLKSILACQLREIDEEEFRAKMKSLEDLGIPNFSEINARIEKLRKRIHHTLDDERKCRSKGVQKLRFEIGKVQGMCEAVLDLVYTE